MQKITKRGWIEIGICTAVFAALIIVAAFYDLAINIALYNPSSLYGQFFAKLGELPSYLCIPLVGVILFYQYFFKNKVAGVVWQVACGVIIFFGYFFAISGWFWDNFISDGVDYAIIYKLFFSALLTAGTILGCAKIDRKAMRKLLFFAIFAAVAVALSNIIVQVMKIIWARQRFRTMVDIEKNAALINEFVGDKDIYQGFTPWYKPQLIFKNPLRTEEYMSAYKAIDSDSFKSFPSGHTVAAAASFILIILPDMYDRFKKIKWVFWVVPAVYTLIVAISRIVMGAHYLSDVTFGGFIGFGVACLIRWIMVSKKTFICTKLGIPLE